METLSRRAFIGSGSVLAAGAIVGVSASRAIRRHGPVEIRTYFLTDDPIVFPGTLLSDGDRDLFRIRVFVERGRDAIAEAPLTSMREIMDHGPGAILFGIRSPENKIERLPVAVKVDAENVTFLVGGPRYEKPWPFWLKVSDVRRVL